MHPYLLTATAMGDAYAVAWEFVPPDRLPTHDWSGYKPRPQTGTRPAEAPGRYTDDTLRSIANARVLLAGGAHDPLAYVAALKRIAREDRRPGWSSGFQAFLQSQADEPDAAWFSAIQPRNTNGALMGAAVLGLMPTAAEAAGAARVQARTTHDSEAADCAAAVALAAWAIRTRTCAPKDLVACVCDLDSRADPRLRAEARRTDRVDMSALRTAGAILHILSTAPTQRAIIDATIAMGGDTDSVAASALGISALDPEAFVPDLPDWMATDLEGARAGIPSRQQLAMLDQSLRHYAQRAR